MYSTCIFCNASLGANESVEHFPVGTRLAFDAEKGRLWAVCRACGRWNLSPLEERWEAVEECERIFRGTRVRVSTENVGLARLADATELVRVGRPLRPEFAAWRYGDQFGARARRAWTRGLALGGLGVAAGGALLASPVLLVGMPVLALAALLVGEAQAGATPADTRLPLRALRDNAGRPLVGQREGFIVDVRLRPEPREGSSWSLEVATGYDTRDIRGIVILARHELVGGPALEAAQVFLAGANAWGGPAREVREAVRRIERAGSPERYFHAAEGEARKMGLGHRDLRAMPREIRLALEMASHEDAERRAMEGELAALERRWREAEEIAAVADRLAIPAELDRKLEPPRGG